MFVLHNYVLCSLKKIIFLNTIFPDDMVLTFAFISLRLKFITVASAIQIGVQILDVSVMSWFP